MTDEQFVAADVLLLSTSETNGLCYVETTELDGETNLKCRQCLPETNEIGQNDQLLGSFFLKNVLYFKKFWNSFLVFLYLLGSFDGEIICEKPNNLLNNFNGVLYWKEQQFILDNNRIILRGCVLRNTRWCYGVVIFAGNDTKLMQNCGQVHFKQTSIDRLLNFLIIGVCILFLKSFLNSFCFERRNFLNNRTQIYFDWPFLDSLFLVIDVPFLYDSMRHLGI